jgi:hypothetical protein
MLAVELQAIEPPNRPIQIGDVDMLQLPIGGLASEGLQIVTRDIAFMGSYGSIAEVNATVISLQ